MLSITADEKWPDPIACLRGQWNINKHWHLAGNDGFDVNSDFTWNFQTTVD